MAGPVNLHELEHRLAVDLPEKYRSLLADYPEVLLDSSANFELLADADRILELNQETRRIWPQADYAPIPKTYLLIGEDGCGNLFAIDLSLGDASSVFEFEHEENSWSLCAESLDAYVLQQIKLAKKGDDD